MSSYSCPSSDEVSDEDNHPERLHWWERAPQDPPRRRQRKCRRSRAANSDLGPFVHNPGPDARKLSDREVEKIFAKYIWREAADDRRQERREAERKQRAEARAHAELEKRAARKARVEAKVAEEKAKRDAMAAEAQAASEVAAAKE